MIKSGYLLPRPPKRPANSYALYIREKLKNVTGKIDVTQQTKKLSETFKDISVDVELKEQLKKEFEDEKL